MLTFTKHEIQILRGINCMTEQKCPECGGETYWFILNGDEGFKCKECEFIDVFDHESRTLKMKSLICIIRGHQGLFTTTKNNGVVTEESYHCYRCKATWIKNDKRDIIKFYMVKLV